MTAQPTPIQASTQEHLDVEDIREDLVILKDGGCCLILTTTAVNFGLLSEPEQDATIYAYANFLNSLNFPIQITIRSQKKDISFYLTLLKNAEDKQTTPLLKEQIRKYRIFIEKIVTENEVLDKKFYVTIPFSPLELGISSTVKSKKKLPFPIEHILEKAKIVLYPKKDHLISQFSKLGLKARQLTTQELLDLFYRSYNPESVGQKNDETKNYTTSLVAAQINSSQVSNQTKPVASYDKNIINNSPSSEEPNIKP